MRFRIGTKVEVLTQKEAPSGSWRCAEIIGGNGHKYTVKYDCDLGVFGGKTIERVARKAIRPYPPSVDVLEENWVTGDVVEVFHNFSWKMATVLMVLGMNHILVRLLGSLIELKANKCDIRARLCWQDGEWIVIGKISNRCEDLKFRLPSSRKDNAVTQRLDLITRQSIKFKGNNNVSTGGDTKTFLKRSLKRKHSHLYSQLESHRQELPGEKFVRPFLINKISERVKKDDDCVSLSSSVGSCSVHRNNSRELHSYVYRTDPLENDNDNDNDNDSECSDAESVCELRPQEGNCLGLLTNEIHRLELHAYRSIIEALHASGPLSWEQELLLTNLRDSLHISNDEHLMEVRNLVSSTSCIPC